MENSTGIIVANVDLQESISLLVWICKRTTEIVLVSLDTWVFSQRCL